jgi:predicted choloylglycine hydrolase
MKSLLVTLWDKILKKFKSKKFKIGEDFQFYNFADTNLTGIVLRKGEYAGVVYYYTYAGLNEEGLGARLKFGYQIVQAGEFNRYLLEKDEKFVTLMGDILTELILTETEIEPSRTLYSEESDL